jgi:hypothetical protein
VGELTTDGTGTASFDVLPRSGITYDANASVDGVRAGAIAPFLVTEPTTVPIGFVLPGQTATFSGVVEDLAGHPQPGVTVYLTGPSGRRHWNYYQRHRRR